MGRWQWVSLFISGGAALLGLLGLAGWHAHVTTLIQVAPGHAAMQYNTAICFILAGLSLGMWIKNGNRLLTGCGSVIVALVGALTLGEYVLGVSIGIDQFLYRPSFVVQHDLAAQMRHPGRMAPLSALCFFFLGLAMLALAGRTRPWRLAVAGTLASLVISLGVVALVGYVCGLQGAYGWGQMTQVAVHSAAGFVVLGTGLLLAVWKTDTQSAERTPRWLPVALSVATITASLVLYFALDAKQDTEIVHVVRVAAESASSQVGVRMEGRLKSLVRMATRWEVTGGRSDGPAWQTDADHYIHDFPEMQAIEWIDTSHRLRWITPLAGNEEKLGTNLLNESRRADAAAQAERERQPVITRAVTLFHGGLGYIIYVPVTVDGKPDGVLAAVFQAAPLFERYLPASVATNQAIRISDGGLTVFERDAASVPPNPDWAVDERVELRGVTWEVRVWPTPALLSELDDPLPEIALAAGVLGGLLLGAVCYLAQRASRLGRIAARARDALQRALDEVKTLKGLLPICAYCKRIRDDTGYWSQVDTYLHHHTDVQLSHGYCPECAAKAFTEFGLEIPERVRAELAERNFE